MYSYSNFLHVLVRVGGRTVGKKLKCVNGHETFDLGGQWVGRCVKCPYILQRLTLIRNEVKDSDWFVCLIQCFILI